jgi:hypothetical protein
MKNSEKDKSGRCRLCLRVTQLRRSHIIPELLWRLVYGPTGHTLSIDRDLPYIPEVAKGIRERLLCDGCEQLLKQHEDYFVTSWLRPLPSSLPGDLNEIQISSLDYAAFMAFHLSIAWRASVACHPAFREARLGEYEEPSRQALLEGTVEALGKFRLYGNIVLRPGTRDIATAAMSPPAAIVDGGRLVAHSALYAGVHWTLVLPFEEDLPEDEYALRKDGPLRLRIFDMRDLLPGFCDFFAQQRGRAIEARDKLRRKHPPRRKT